MDRKATFILALLYLAVILAIGLIFFVKRDLLFFVPDAFGPVPLGVPWFGALGAVLISLTGVFEHEHDWDASYWPWHVARPLIGVAVAVVSVLILQAGVLAVGSTPIQQPTPTPTPTPASTQTAATPTPTPAVKPTPTPTGTVTQTPTPTPTPTPQGPGQAPPANSKGPVPTNLLYYLVAFLVGYREETFRELIKRLVDIILAPGDGKAAPPTIHDINPAEAPHGTPTPVTITGSGFTSTQSVKFGGSAAQFTVNGDSKITATTPTPPTAGAAVVTVTTKSGAASVDFIFS
jgi:hypothetical protein